MPSGTGGLLVSILARAMAAMAFSISEIGARPPGGRSLISSMLAVCRRVRAPEEDGTFFVRSPELPNGMFQRQRTRGASV